jgi:hypothetical protein
MRRILTELGQLLQRISKFEAEAPTCHGICLERLKKPRDILYSALNVEDNLDPNIRLICSICIQNIGR